jgi:hypothetical protein
MQFKLCIMRLLSRAQRTSLLGVIGLLAAAGLLLAAGAPPQAHAQQNGVLIDQVGPNNAADNDATQIVSGSGNVAQIGQGRLLVGPQIRLYEDQGGRKKGTSAKNEALQNIRGNNTRAAILQGVGKFEDNSGNLGSVARDNDATQIVRGNGNGNVKNDFFSENLRIVQGAIGGGRKPVTAIGNEATQIVKGNRNKEVGIEQGTAGGTARDNEVTQSIDGNRNKSVTVSQGVNPSGTARDNEATQTVNGNNNFLEIQQGRSAVATENDATQTVSGSGHDAGITQGILGGQSRRNDANQTLKGQNHTAFITQQQGAIGGVKSLDNTATQNLRGTGHTAVILQMGQGNTATQIVNN